MKFMLRVFCWLLNYSYFKLLRMAKPKTFLNPVCLLANGLTQKVVRDEG